MTICEKCKNKTCLKTKKPCEAVEKLLRKEGIFSRDYCRKRREIPFSSLPIKMQKHLGLTDFDGDDS